MSRIPKEAGGSDGRLSSLPEPGSGSLPPGLHQVPTGGHANALLVLPRVAHPAPAPLLVFHHGAGGASRDALPQMEDAAAAFGVALLLPASAASTWDSVLGAPGPDVTALDDALQLAARAAAVDRRRVAIGGFSDGASHALSVGLANGDLFGAVLAFSPGFSAPPRRRGRPRVFVSHGTGDTVLPVRCGRRVEQTLRQGGYDVAYEEFPDGHVLPPATAVTALRWWLQQEQGR